MRALLKSSLFLILAALSASPPPQKATQLAPVQPFSIVGPSRVAFPATPHRKGFELVIEDELETPEPHFPDFFVLRIETTDDEPYSQLATLKFESTYGKFDLYLIDLTGDGIEEFVLITGENRGTSVREETLRIYRRAGAKFIEILATPQSGFFGDSQWRYQRQYTDLNADGILDLSMALEHDPIDKSNTVQDPSLIPRIKRKNFAYDPRTRRMRIFPGK